MDNYTIIHNIIIYLLWVITSWTDSIKGRIENMHLEKIKHKYKYYKSKNSCAFRHIRSRFVEINKTFRQKVTKFSFMSKRY